MPHRSRARVTWPITQTSSPNVCALRVQAEVVAGHALIGTHRDDMEIRFDGHDLRKFGSAGQQRSALLLLQLANIAVFHATRGEYPLFLLDDIDAELDYRRIGQLLEFLQGKIADFCDHVKGKFCRKIRLRSRLFSRSRTVPPKFS